VSSTVKKTDSTFKYRISNIPGGESILSCYSCGVCTAACPVNKVIKDFNPRQIIKKTLMGFKDDVLSSDLIWYCQQCEKCFANCPQKVNFSHIVRALRETAVNEGYAEPDMQVKIENIDDLIQKTRKKLIDAVLKNKTANIKKVFKDTVSKLSE
jgi:heterodisulfide reductase subunit C2